VVRRRRRRRRVPRGSQRRRWHNSSDRSTGPAATEDGGLIRIESNSSVESKTTTWKLETGERGEKQRVGSNSVEYINWEIVGRKLVWPTCHRDRKCFMGAEIARICLEGVSGPGTARQIGLGWRGCGPATIIGSTSARPRLTSLGFSVAGFQAVRAS
jgi:hypothetical protein